VLAHDERNQQDKETYWEAKTTQRSIANTTGPALTPKSSKEPASAGDQGEQGPSGTVVPMV
jgi:hypothetical protein